MAKLGTELRDLNLRNHELQRAVLGLQYAVARDPVRYNGSTAQIGVLPAIALSRWTIEVHGNQLRCSMGAGSGVSTDPRACLIGRLICALRNQPDVLTALGARAPAGERRQYAHMLTHSIFNPVSADTALLLGVMERAIVNSLPGQLVNADDHAMHGSKLFCDDMLS